MAGLRAITRTSLPAAIPNEASLLIRAADEVAIRAIDATAPTGRSVTRNESLAQAAGARRIHLFNISMNRPLSTNSYPHRGQRTIEHPCAIGQLGLHAPPS